MHTKTYGISVLALLIIGARLLVSFGGEVPLENDPENLNLAYVSFDQMIGTDDAMLKLDRVKWLNDNSQPNGYLILNDVIENEPFTITMWADCYVWRYTEENGMERYQVSLADFLFTLEQRGGVMLVDYEVNAEASITYISEVYTP